MEDKEDDGIETFDLSIPETNALDELIDEIEEFLLEIQLLRINTPSLIDFLKWVNPRGSKDISKEDFLYKIYRIFYKWDDTYEVLQTYQEVGNLTLWQISWIKSLHNILSDDKAKLSTLQANINRLTTAENTKLYDDIKAQHYAVWRIFLLFLEEVARSSFMPHGGYYKNFLPWDDFDEMIKVIETPGLWLRKFMEILQADFEISIAPDNKWAIADKYAQEHPETTPEKYTSILTENVNSNPGGLSSQRRN